MKLASCLNRLLIAFHWLYICESSLRTPDTPVTCRSPTPPPKDVPKAPSHTYPPALPESAAAGPSAEVPKSPVETVPGTSPKKHRFFFFRRSKKKQGGDLEEGTGKSNPKQKDPEDEWEANWERGDYPFVKLPENRATCAICLLDFEEPPRKGTVLPSSVSAEPVKSKDKDHKVQVEPSSLALQDAGEGATPLRLLACGHAFHQVCLDP